MATVVLHSVVDRLLGLLFPDRCAGCKRSGALFCAACQAALKPYLPDDTIFPGLDAAGVAYVFASPLREAVHCLKYERLQRMAAPLGDLLVVYLRANPLPADAVLAVPLHSKRLAERGFNQAELLACRLAQQSRLPLLSRGLVRCRDTEHQARLDRSARRANVTDAFAWIAAEPPPLRILLIDDVLTTGATLGACADALRAAGAREVRALALARSRVRKSGMVCS